MNRSKTLLLSAFLSLGALGASAGWLRVKAGPAKARLSSRFLDVKARIERLSAGTVPLEQALETLSFRRVSLRSVLGIYENLFVPVTGEFLPKDKSDPANHFKRLLVSMRQEASGGDIFFETPTPFGFKSPVQEDKDVRLALLRLAAAGRLLTALRAAAGAGPVYVASVEHLPPRRALFLEDLFEGPVILPMKLSFTARERSVAVFLDAVSSAASAAGLESLAVEASSSREGLAVDAVLEYFFLDASDVLPEKEAPPGIPARRRRW